jgi:hypothetical protein
MSILTTALPAPWQYYADRARDAHCGPANDFNLGREEQLWAILESIEKGESFDDQCRMRLDRIPQNRAKKYRRLLQTMANLARSKQVKYRVFLETRDEVEVVKRHLTLDERFVENRLAACESYSEIALSLGISVPALKVRVSRWRKRVRHSITYDAA